MATTDNALLTVSNARLYAGAISVVSGLYVVVLAMLLTGAAAPLAPAAWAMLALGLLLLAHGFLLFTPFVERALGGASGPLMILYGVALLLVQGWMAWAAGGAEATAGALAEAGWTAGVVALAVLLLASGAILAARQDRVYAPA